MELIGASVVVLITIVIVYLYGYMKYSHEYWKSKGIPHDKPKMPYGNATDFGTTVNQSVFTKRIYDKYKSTGAKLAGLYFITRPIALLLDLDLIKNVLVKDFNNFNDRGLYYNEKDEPICAHLFALDGEPWKRLRSKLSPAFSSGKMKFMFPTIVDVADRFRECLTEAAQLHDEVEIKDFLSRYTIDVIGTSAFGIECNSLKDPNAEFACFGREVFGKMRYSDVVYLFIGGFKNLAKRLHMKVLRDDVSGFFTNIVSETVEQREKNRISRNDFMNILINLKNEETDKDNAITFNEIVAQAFVFFIAGFETSSTTLTFCLYELAQNAEVQEKARKVVREAYAKHNGRFTYEMMMDMPYIDQVLNETLRKYPSVGYLMRDTKSNYQVPNSNIIIDKGVNIMIPVYAIHHDPEYYPDPEKFDPDRFGREEVQKRNPMTWLPFGDGPRNCIGSRFGMMQARIGLVTVLNSFEFSLAPGMQGPLVFGKQSIFLTPEGGVRLRIKSIN